MLRSIATALVASWLMFSAVFAAEHTKDPLPEVKERVTKGDALLIDVREKSEWDDGHLKAAKRLSLSQLRKGVSAEELQSLLTKEKIIYLHCFSGGRCLEAADRLQKAGYEVRPLKPGYKDLLSAGFEKAAE
ncbi:rhodanese-like domain-containing protein [bacterium]|nr:rhodanese-like domain-containing protein [bacterium]